MNIRLITPAQLAILKAGDASCRADDPDFIALHGSGLIQIEERGMFSVVWSRMPSADRLLSAPEKIS
jgi:hypothetical protein